LRILLDTHCWLWAIEEPGRLNDRAVSILENEEIDAFLSAASAWEIAIKYGQGRLKLSEPPVSFIPSRLARDGYAVLPIHLAHAIEAGGLPPLHRDPFDRILVAQARIEEMTILTADPKILAYDVEAIRAA